MLMIIPSLTDKEPAGEGEDGHELPQAADKVTVPLNGGEPGLEVRERQAAEDDHDGGAQHRPAQHGAPEGLAPDDHEADGRGVDEQPPQRLETFGSLEELGAQLTHRQRRRAHIPENTTHEIVRLPLAVGSVRRSSGGEPLFGAAYRQTRGSAHWDFTHTMYSRASQHPTMKPA
jgi:hypothetical protein